MILGLNEPKKLDKVDTTPRTLFVLSGHAGGSSWGTATTAALPQSPNPQGPRPSRPRRQALNGNALHPRLLGPYGYAIHTLVLSARNDLPIVTADMNI